MNGMNDGAAGLARNLASDEEFNERVRVFREFLDNDVRRTEWIRMGREGREGDGGGRSSQAGPQ